MNDAAVRAVDVPALRTSKLVDTLVLICAGNTRISNDDLAVPIYVPRAGRFVHLHCIRPAHFFKHGGIEERREFARNFATHVNAVQHILVVIFPAQSFDK